MKNGVVKDEFEGSLDGMAVKNPHPKNEADEPIINEALEIFGGEVEGRNRKNGGPSR